MINELLERMCWYWSSTLQNIPCWNIYPDMNFYAHNFLYLFLELSTNTIKLNQWWATSGIITMCVDRVNNAKDGRFGHFLLPLNKIYKEHLQICIRWYPYLWYLTSQNFHTRNSGCHYYKMWSVWLEHISMF